MYWLLRKRKVRLLTRFLEKKNVSSDPCRVDSLTCVKKLCNIYISINISGVLCMFAYDLTVYLSYHGISPKDL